MRVVDWNGSTTLGKHSADFTAVGPLCSLSRLSVSANGARAASRCCGFKVWLLPQSCILRTLGLVPSLSPKPRDSSVAFIPRAVRPSPSCVLSEMDNEALFAQPDPYVNFGVYFSALLGSGSFSLICVCS